MGNRCPYHGLPIDTMGSGVEDVVDFEVRVKVVKSFLRKHLMYNPNINVKAMASDVDRIKGIVLAAPNSEVARSSFKSVWAIGRTVSGLPPCSDPIDNCPVQNSSRPIRDLTRRVILEFSPTPMPFRIRFFRYRPGFRSRTPDLPEI